MRNETEPDLLKMLINRQFNIGTVTGTCNSSHVSENIPMRPTIPNGKENEIKQTPLVTAK